jgi:hypothetical protein
MENWLRLRPTTEQYQAFADYLCEAHSWYKHLPLMGGRRFVVFVAPDAGIGCLVAVLNSPDPKTATSYKLVTPKEGPEFTDAHPRLHYGWRTTNEYRRRFGYLDYMCRTCPEEPYARDAGSPVRLPDQLEERCGFQLYPYVSATFSEAVIWSIHSEAIEQLRDGTIHPAREEVLELAKLAQAIEVAWHGLRDPEQLWVLSDRPNGEKSKPEKPSVDLLRYLELDGKLEAVSDSLQAKEADKIRRGLAALDDWLLHGG